MGARRIDVTWFGKAGTFCLMFAFPLFLLGNVDAGPWSTFGEVLAWVCAHPRPGAQLHRRSSSTSRSAGRRCGTGRADAGRGSAGRSAR